MVSKESSIALRGGPGGCRGESAADPRALNSDGERILRNRAALNSDGERILRSRGTLNSDGERIPTDSSEAAGP